MPILPTGKSAGFSLVELIVVLALIGLAVGLIAPRLGQSDILVLKSDARRLVAVLNYARRGAVIRGQAMRALLLPPPENEEEAPPTDEASAAAQPEKSNELRWQSHEARLEWKTAPEKPTGGLSGKETADGDGFEFYFYPEGGSSGGELWLKHAGHQALLRVHPLTGQVGIDFEAEK